jgi:hypothetical protein
MEPVLHRSTPLQLVNEMSPVRGAGALTRSRNLWGRVARPTRFERVTSTFGEPVISRIA